MRVARLLVWLGFRVEFWTDVVEYRCDDPTCDWAHYRPGAKHWKLASPAR